MENLRILIKHRVDEAHRALANCGAFFVYEGDNRGPEWRRETSTVPVVVCTVVESSESGSVCADVWEGSACSIVYPTVLAKVGGIGVGDIVRKSRVMVGEVFVHCGVLVGGPCYSVREASATCEQFGARTFEDPVSKRDLIQSWVL